ncbi:RSPH4A family protein [Megaselia abdita]
MCEKDIKIALENCSEELSIVDGSCNCIISQDSHSSQESLYPKKCKHHKLLKTKKIPPNIQHEVNMAKSILQEISSISGNNLFDHLAEIIKQVLDNRPPNIIDFFEEYSRNLREQKWNMPENFTDVEYKPTNQNVAADKILASLKLPQISVDGLEFCEETEMEIEKYQNDKAAIGVKFGRELNLHENFLLMQYHWSLCGLSFHQREVYQLSLSLQNLQQHPVVENCRFWGKIFGLKKSYLIAEVDLTLDEIRKRETLMIEEINERISWYARSHEIGQNVSPILKLTPGTNWCSYPTDELSAMKPIAVGIPQSQYVPSFDIPPELIGTGLNRKSYFVINESTDNWIELPIVTPKQIDVARKIKKLFTGNLETEIFSFPLFPGREKHLLRATIARITSGTLISPSGYYKRQGKQITEHEEEEHEHENEEDGILDNDDIICLNEDYKPHDPRDLMHILNWVHVRPHIIPQGRIKYFNLEKELRDYKKHQNLSPEEEELEEELDEEEDIDYEQPAGPPLFETIKNDRTTENIPNWTVRFSSIHNQINRMVLIKSNLWPGSYTFSYKLITDSIYIGWGQKYIARNYSPIHLPPIQEEYPNDTTIHEISDPTQEEEALYALSKIKPELLHLNDLFVTEEEGEEEEADD